MHLCQSVMLERSVAEVPGEGNYVQTEEGLTGAIQLEHRDGMWCPTPDP